MVSARSRWGAKVGWFGCTSSWVSASVVSAPLLSPPSAAGLYAAPPVNRCPEFGRAGRDQRANPTETQPARCQQQAGGPFSSTLLANGDNPGFDVGDTTKRANKATNTMATMTCHTRLTLMGNSS